MRYLDPKNDLPFKRIFGEHPHLCMSLLNSLLPLNANNPIVELEYLSPELVPEIPILKRTIVDVRCKDKSGRQFIVEMQMYWTESFKSRVMFNASKAYVKQLLTTQNYNLLQPVYVLSLVNEDFEHQIPEYYHHYSMVHSLYSDKQIKGLELVFVELQKFKAKNLRDKKLQVLWLRFLTEIDNQSEDIPSEFIDDATIHEALNCLETNSYTKEELDHYDRFWDSIITEKSSFTDAEERGRKDGVTEGKIEGKIEREIEIAKKALSKGMDIEVIIDLTGLSADEINKLKD